MEYWEMVTINLSATGAKEAAARLREFLAANGISLKQTHAYEALAQTLGYANWNTLQALLNTTATPENKASPEAAALAFLPPAVRAEMQDARERMRKSRLTPSLEQSLHRAIGFATERHHEYATLEHLLFSLTEDQDAASVILGCHVDMDQLRKALTDHIDSKLEHLVTTVPGAAKPTTNFQLAVQRAILHVSKLGRDEITGANVLVSLFTDVESHAVRILNQQGLTRIDAVNYIANSRGEPLDGGQSA
jgi:hypothetical protein